MSDPELPGTDDKGKEPEVREPRANGLKARMNLDSSGGSGSLNLGSKAVNDPASDAGKIVATSIQKSDPVLPKASSPAPKPTENFSDWLIDNPLSDDESYSDTDEEEEATFNTYLNQLMRTGQSKMGPW